jgi:hypothetical protein
LCAASYLRPDKLRGAAAVEFLLAIATRRLRLADNDYKELCREDATGVSPLVDYLLAWCKAHPYETAATYGEQDSRQLAGASIQS